MHDKSHRIRMARAAGRRGWMMTDQGGGLHIPSAAWKAQLTRFGPVTGEREGDLSCAGEAAVRPSDADNTT